MRSLILFLLSFLLIVCLTSLCRADSVAGANYAFSGADPRSQDSDKSECEGDGKPCQARSFEIRAQSGVDWAYALCRGQQLLQKIKIQTPGSPKFNSFSDFQQYGYRIRSGPVDDDINDDAYTSLGLPKGEEWKTFDAMSMKRNIVKGGSINSFTYIATNGAFSCETTKVPAEAQPDVLSRLSDIMFLMWQHACEEAGTEPGSLSYVFRNHVTNTETLSIIGQALHSADVANTKPWPGTDFHMTTEAGEALLGSPNGIAIGWMLIDRQTTFPGKTVSKVTVYLDDVKDTSMVFHIGNLQSD